VDAPVSSLEGVSADAKTRAAAWGRRAFLMLVLLVVVAALCGFLGMRKATASATGDGYGISLTCARIARAGLDVPWKLTITHPGGFSGPVTIQVTSTYFEMFESQGIMPQPSNETDDGQWWTATFAPPQGDTLVVTLDVYVQPVSKQGRSGTVAVLDHHVPAVSVDFKTTLLP
jgi:hypothetical protein